MNLTKRLAPSSTNIIDLPRAISCGAITIIEVPCNISIGNNDIWPWPSAKYLRHDGQHLLHYSGKIKPPRYGYILIWSLDDIWDDFDKLELCLPLEMVHLLFVCKSWGWVSSSLVDHNPSKRFYSNRLIEFCRSTSKVNKFLCRWSMI